MNQQPTEWEKMIAKHISDIRLVSRIYKELSKLIKNFKKPTNNPIFKKWTNDLKTLNQKRYMDSE